ncbi:MAG TPA: TonB-dependent receptor, partial [Opitutus sp.]|nr:TonB-dependent receptor [Opitutus sp.]
RRSVKLRASYGTAFRSPSFLDLYGRSAFYVGNPELEAERARGWDAGVDYYLPENRGRWSATWFDTRFRDLIAYDFTVFPSTVRNIEQARTRGLEVSARHPIGGTDLRLAYTYLEAINSTQQIRLVRRPRHALSADFWRELGRGFSAGVGVGFVADRRDVHAETFATIDAEDYTVARIYAEWQASERLKLTLRLENLLDERYEEVNGYPALGRGVFAGAAWRF